MAKTITFTIEKDGSGADFDMGDGFKGKECLEESKAFEEALGKVDKRKMKTDKGITIGDKVKVGQ